MSELAMDKIKEAEWIAIESARKLKVPTYAKSDLKDILNSYKKGKYRKRKAEVLAAGFIYLVVLRNSLNNVKQHNIAKSCNITETSVREIMKKPFFAERDPRKVGFPKLAVKLTKIFAERADLKRNVSKAAVEFAEQYESENQNPGDFQSSIAACCIYLAVLINKDNTGVWDIVECCDIDMSAIQNKMKLHFFATRDPRKIGLKNLILDILNEHPQGLLFDDLRRKLKTDYKIKIQGILSVKTASVYNTWLEKTIDLLIEKEKVAILDDGYEKVLYVSDLLKE
jgi:transcription initiation factor TFIIIB Brf1 subunit/transcription initiation factor TFIIB